MAAIRGQLGTQRVAASRPVYDSWMSDPVAEAVSAAVEAIHVGDVSALRELLAAHPDLATARLTNVGGRTLLHVATDWPGHRPNVGATVRALVEAGADVNAVGPGRHPETALHWAASSDDLEALDALLDAGADINVRGAVIADGTPLADATAFGQWQAARRLLERGAVATAWEAAAMGVLPEVRELLADEAPGSQEITSCFWGACHGGHRETAAYLLERGADINWVGWDDFTPLDAARRTGAEDLVDWLRQHGGRSAAQATGLEP
jgi:ankyrin repeat protein